ncbi:MAG: gliding motility-associated ABC transporter substrate-binding protein GldG [Bacteroidales bacterium]|nr:gliding motility-associated ABC transporter substrate-binding protein GldG [Bacteroidales bacterium]MCF8326761.1 gliding motility-associated ABC transporter substrate-binding protein GldG [Bacteroidales bacterium]
MSNKKNVRKQNIVQLLLGLAIIILVNIIGQYFFTRFDLTSEKKYTLSQSTKELVKSFDDYVTFKVYLDGSFPAGFKKLQRETREMLDEFHAYNSNINYEFINPNEVVEDKKNKNSFYAELNRKGLDPTTIQSQDGARQSQQVLFPGALVTYKANREEAINLLESRMDASSEEQINESIQALEYNLASALMKLKSAEKDKIAFLHGHGELPKANLDGAEKALSEFYNIDHLILENKVYSLLKRTEPDSAGNVHVYPRYKSLIIAQPTRAFTEKEKFFIDQYVMHGGKVMWLVDPVATSMDSLQAQSRTLAVPADLNLDDMFFRYGVRLNKNLIQDMRSAAIPVNTQPKGSKPKFKLFPWPYFPVISPNSNHPIVKNLNGIKGEFVSTLDTISGNNVTKTMLLKSSQYSRVLSTPHAINLNIINRKPQRSQYNHGSQNIGVLLEGKFSSLFENRIPPEIAQNKAMAFRTESEKNQMIVVADGNIIKNAISIKGGERKKLPLGVDKYTGQQYGNEDFIVNAVNYLCDDSGLLNVRTRDLKIRLMDRAKVQEERLKWQIINVVIPVLLILIMSVIWNIIRKRKYTRPGK